MTISAAEVKALRDQTGAAMMECKRALEAAGGDHEAAALALKERGLLVAQAREERATDAGRLALRVNGTRGAIVKLLCETDFVALNEQFIELADRIAEHAARTGGGYRSDAPTPAWMAVVGEWIDEATARIREKIVLASVVVIDAADDERLVGYTHPDGTIASIVRIECRDDTQSVSRLGHDIALHVAAFAPRFVRRADIAMQTLTELRDEFRAQAQELGKSDAITGRIVEGRIEKYIRANTLLEQPFVRNEDETVGGLVSAFVAETQCNAKVTGFAYDSVRELKDAPGTLAISNRTE